MYCPPNLGRDSPSADGIVIFSHNYSKTGVALRLWGGVPRAVTDIVRRVRRCFGGSSRFIGGPEWPLVGTEYSSDYLEEISRDVRSVDDKAKTEIVASV